MGFGFLLFENLESASVCLVYDNPNDDTLWLLTHLVI